jgi:hypothetical protein
MERKRQAEMELLDLEAPEVTLRETDVCAAALAETL